MKRPRGLIVALAVAVCALMPGAPLVAEETPGPELLRLAAMPAQCPAGVSIGVPSPIPMAATAYCAATCYTDTQVSCSGSSCSALDSSCPSQRGYVVCDGVYTYCPSCPSQVCTNGATQWVNWGCCCGAPVAKQNHRQQVCVNGQWSTTNTYACFGLCSNPNGCDLEP